LRKNWQAGSITIKYHFHRGPQLHLTISSHLELSLLLRIHDPVPWEGPTRSIVVPKSAVPTRQPTAATSHSSTKHTPTMSKYTHWWLLSKSEIQSQGIDTQVPTSSSRRAGHLSDSMGRNSKINEHFQLWALHPPNVAICKHDDRLRRRIFATSPAFIRK